MTVPVAWAEPPAKLGVVNVSLLIEQAPQAKAASKKLEQEFAPQQKELEKLAKKLDGLQKDYAKNKLAMSATQRTAKEREIALLTREIQRRRSDIQELVNLRRNEELSKLQALINQAIREIGESQKYDLILYDGIAFSSKRIDITPQVLQYLQKRYKQQKAAFNR
ncbi:periplasmic chaperone for outer membrane proteins Skp [Sulfurivirga caldicuralii]|uniref:Periplasmic chaperone for outer membrane proteins Skp n=1 Tax=Sulfurivirga caldicuralii TaxID=364032 RepID=A0A1N6E0N6_9GAMM|nr:OmpH family outer membrane protein [Sulfurivirga caldicuralii]SIN76551.1 periplasmic chaperone for outer membrane proteins Skp [Sulfurivirga caldicuralii]